MQSIIVNFQNWLALITDKPLYPGLEKYNTVLRVRYNSFWNDKLNPLRREQNNPAWKNAETVIDSYVDYDVYDENNYLNAEDNV